MFKGTAGSHQHVLQSRLSFRSILASSHKTMLLAFYEAQSTKLKPLTEFIYCVFKIVRDFHFQNFSSLYPHELNMLLSKLFEIF